VVDDGSKDETYKKAKKLKSSVSCDLIMIKHQHNLGKGFAVKSGILQAQYDLILYSDVGDIVPFENALDGIKELKKRNADIAHGSRKLPNSNIVKQQDSDRKIASWIFNKFIRDYLNVPSNLTDTQCGFKIYKKEIGKNLFSQLQTKGFLFEIEIILRAKQNNYKIIEFPLIWKCDRDSRINFWKTSLQVTKEVLSIKKMFN